MIPGLGSDMLGKAGEEESAKRIKRFIVIMDSMCDAGAWPACLLSLFVFLMCVCFAGRAGQRQRVEAVSPAAIPHDTHRPRFGRHRAGGQRPAYPVRRTVLAVFCSVVYPPYALLAGTPSLRRS